MTFISRGEVYDYPMSECDLDALVENITEPPAAAESSGAGFPVPVSDPAPGTPNETRNR